MIATLCEDGGQRFASAGDYVPGEDGELYRLVSVGPRIVIDDKGRGAPNYIPGCIVESADWSDCPDGNESSCRLRDVQPETASEGPEGGFPGHPEDA